MNFLEDIFENFGRKRQHGDYSQGHHDDHGRQHDDHYSYEHLR